MIELSELIVFSYHLSNTQGGLSCWRNGIYILWLTVSLCDKNSGERSRTHESSCWHNENRRKISYAGIIVNIKGTFFFHLKKSSVQSPFISSTSMLYTLSVTLDCYGTGVATLEKEKGRIIRKAGRKDKTQ